MRKTKRRLTDVVANIQCLLDYYFLLLSRFRSPDVTESVIGQRSSQPRNTKGESIRVMPPPLLLSCEQTTLESRAFIQLSFIRLLL